MVAAMSVHATRGCGRLPDLEAVVQQPGYGHTLFMTTKQSRHTGQRSLLWASRRSAAGAGPSEVDHVGGLR